MSLYVYLMVCARPWQTINCNRYTQYIPTLFFIFCHIRQHNIIRVQGLYYNVRVKMIPDKQTLLKFELLILNIICFTYWKCGFSRPFENAMSAVVKVWEEPVVKPTVGALTMQIYFASSKQKSVSARAS